MVKLLIDPADLHHQIWESINSSIYGHCLVIAPVQREQLTIQFFHTALEDLFLSIPETVGARYEDLLADYVDQAEMTKMMVAFGYMEEPEVIVSTQNRMGGSSMLGATVVDRVEVTRPNFPARATLAQMAFDEQFIRFSEYVERLIMVSLKRMNRKFNRYRTVEVIPHTGPRGGITALELALGEDIRHKFFREHFGNGRYAPGHEPQIRDEPSVPEDS